MKETMDERATTTAHKHGRSAIEQIAFLLRFDIRVINQLKSPFIFGSAVVDAISHSLWGHTVRFICWLERSLDRSSVDNAS